MPDDPIVNETSEVRTIRQLARLMQKYDLTAIDLGDGPTRIRLRRRGVELAAPVYAPAAPVAYALPSSTAAFSVTEPIVAATPAGAMIESPMVGTFYSSNTPDAPPVVTVGSTVRAETIVCIIEAMKVFTDIPAGIAGTIAEVLVKNGQPVEYGQPMFRLTQ